MAKKAARRQRGAPSSTTAQKKRRKRLQHFNHSAKLAHRSNVPGWDNNLSLKTNYKKLGIAYDPNLAMATPNESFANPIAQLLPKRNGIMTERLEYLQSLPPPAPYEVKSMNVQEQYQLQRLIAAHEDDYEKMERDIKLNPTQSTARQLQKRIELMFRLQQANNDDDGEYDEDDEDAEDEEDIMNALGSAIDGVKDELDMDHYNNKQSDDEEDDDKEEEEPQQKKQPTQRKLNAYNQHLEKLKQQAQQQRAAEKKKAIQPADVTKEHVKFAAPGIVVPKLKQLKIKGKEQK